MSTLATESPSLVPARRSSGDLVEEEAMKFGNLLLELEMKLASRLFDNKHI